MSDERMEERVSEVSALLLDNVLSACRRLDVEPRVLRGLEGTDVLDARGHKVATLRVVLDSESGGVAARVDIRCDRLRSEMSAS
jgi:hypothetical protein